MPSQQRINDLKSYVEQWKSALVQITEQRDTLLDIQNKYFITDKSGKDWLQQKIRGADMAVLSHQENLTIMESLLLRAQSGENV
jgi:hypothetical protein